MLWHNDWDDDDYTPRASTEIYDLRRKGRLEEARQKAEELLRQDNTDQDVWKAYAWTLIDICKREQQQGNIEGARQISDYLSRLRFNTTYDEFAETLIKKIQQLRLTVNPFYAQIQEAKELSQNGDNDRAWAILRQLAVDSHLPKEAHESYGWTIYRHLRDHISILNSVEVRSLLRDYINLKNERPSNLHSQILNFALNYSKQDNKFKLVSFLRLWGPDNLRDSDFDDSHGNDGKPIPSLMSRIARVVVNYPINEVQEFVELLPRRKNEFIEMMKEHYFWKLYHSTDGDVDTSTWNLFREYLTFFPDAPASLAHSKVLGLAERVMKGNNVWRFYDFFRLWNPEKLRDDDWKEKKGNNGETYKPLAVKSLKKAREAIEALSDKQIGDLQWLIDLYGTAVKKFPDDDWNIRSKALLHLRAGQLAKAQSIYKDLCLKMGEKYYIWSEFAECWKDTGVKIALLCKALSLEKNEDFIGKIRLELARQLIKAKKYENAAVELEQYKKHYTEMGWRVDAEIDTLLRQCSSVTPTNDKNVTFYEENISIAEEHAYADIPYTEMVLVNKWKNDEGKEIMTFVDGDIIEFATNKKRFPTLRNSHEGQVWRFIGKYNLFLHIVLFDPDLDGRRAKQMPCIHKPNADSICKVDFFVIIASNKTVDRSLCIVDIIQRHNFCPAGTLPFSVLPFRLKHLYVCTVSQHNITQIRSCSRRKNLSPKSPLVQKRKFTGMVDMSMRQKYHVNVTCRNRYLLIFKFIRSLLHSTVNQNMFSAGFQISTASSHLMRGSQKCNPHKNTFSLF